MFFVYAIVKLIIFPKVYPYAIQRQIFFVKQIVNYFQSLFPGYLFPSIKICLIAAVTEEYVNISVMAGIKACLSILFINQIIIFKDVFKSCTVNILTVNMEGSLKTIPHHFRSYTHPLCAFHLF